MPDILVVDDNVDVATSTAELLRMYDHAVRVAYGGEQALREIEQARPETVVLDIGMPFVDGLSVARRVRERYGRSIRLVAHTALSDVMLSTILNAGFDCFLAKPASADQLLLAIRKVGHPFDRRAAKGERRHTRRCDPTSLRRRADDRVLPSL